MLKRKTNVGVRECTVYSCFIKVCPANNVTIHKEIYAEVDLELLAY